MNMQQLNSAAHAFDLEARAALKVGDTAKMTEMYRRSCDTRRYVSTLLDGARIKRVKAINEEYNRLCRETKVISIEALMETVADNLGHDIETVERAMGVK